MTFRPKSITKPEMKVLDASERTKPGRERGIRESRKEPPIQLPTPAPGGGGSALSSWIMRRSCANIFAKSASDNDFDAAGNDIPEMRSMTM
jgi:hypothetical protein